MTTDTTSFEKKNQECIEANIALHSRMADEYNSNEPHFRPENVDKVEQRLIQLAKITDARKLLDLGCGTGFIVNIARKYVDEVHGVDVTKAMLEKIEIEQPGAKVVLHNCDSAKPPVSANSFDIVTAYSFLHHLFDATPTMEAAYKALRSGGRFFCDLEPNFHFWQSINVLERNGSYDEIVLREIEMVTYKDEDIEKQFGVSPKIFNSAEYGKSVLGGFSQEWLEETLTKIGFKDIKIEFNWFVGQGQLINNPDSEREQNLILGDSMSYWLKKSLPLSRGLFKYIGFEATK